MHSHSHSHSHHSHSNQKDVNRRPLIWVFALSFLYLFAEIIGGLLSGSLALLADAGHMAIDVFAIALSLFATWIAQKPPTERNTYGYYRAEILAALLNGATLVAIALWIIYEAWERFRSPIQVQGSLMTIVAVGGLVVNLVSLYLMNHGSHRDNLNMRGVWLHIWTDTLGSVAAIGAGAVVWKFNWAPADPLISIVISILILYGSWNLLSECVNVLLEACPRHIDVTKVKTSMEQIQNVTDVHDLHVWTVTSGVISLSAHVGIKEDGKPVKILADLTGVLKREFGIEHVTLQLEPTSYTHQPLDF